MTTAQAPLDPSTPWVDGLTIGQALRETARRHPHRDAFVFCNPPAKMTWAEFDAAVDRVGRGLLALGFAPGDHFGVWATNVPEWVMLQFATARIGVVLVNINPAYRPGELKYALRQSDVRGLALVDAFKSSNYFAMLNEVCPELAAARPASCAATTFPKLQWVVSLRGDAAARRADVGRTAGSGGRRAARADSTKWRPDSVRTTRSTFNTPPARPASPRARCCRIATCCSTATTPAQCQRLDHDRPHLHSGAALPLLRLRAGHAVLRRPRRGDGRFRPKVFNPAPRWPPSNRSAAPRSTACPRCSSPSSSTTTIRGAICRRCAPASWPAAPARSR